MRRVLSAKPAILRKRQALRGILFILERIVVFPFTLGAFKRYYILHL
jgi:hypothetical protein